MKKPILVAALAVVALAGAILLHQQRSSQANRTVRWPVMGTIAQVTLRGESPDETAILATVRATYDRLNGLLSAWDSNSELCRLAAAGCTNWVEAASDEVRPCYAAALKLADESGHAFNPHMGRKLRALGVGGGTYSDFDLGAIAKGYAVDRAAEELGKGTVPVPPLLLDLVPGSALEMRLPKMYRTRINFLPILFFSARDSFTDFFKPSVCKFLPITAKECSTVQLPIPSHTCPVQLPIHRHFLSRTHYRIGSVLPGAPP